MDVVLAKTARTAQVLGEMTSVPVQYVPWSTFWPIHEPTPLHEPLCLYFNAGVGGLADRRHVPLVLQTLQRLLPRFDHVRAVVKCHPHIRKYYPDLTAGHPRIEFIEAEYSLDAMMALQRAADLTLYPSRFEGLGYPLLESLHCGVPVVTTDASPMNEFIVHEENGWLVPCRPVDQLKHAPVMEVDGAAFEATLAGLLERPDRLAAVKARCTQGLCDRARAFQAGMRGLVRRVFPRTLNCGAGEDANVAAYNLDVRPIAGIDVVGLADRLPFASDSFARVGAYDVLEHVPQQAGPELLCELIRVLAPGGELEVRVPDLRALAWQFIRGKLSVQDFALYLYGKQDHPYNFHQAGYDASSLRSLFEACGLREVQRVRDSQSSKNVLLRGRKPA